MVLFSANEYVQKSTKEGKCLVYVYVDSDLVVDVLEKNWGQWIKPKCRRSNGLF